ncbi:MAG: AIR synthase-related protein, partial [Candidatus Brocadiales bacterium]
WFLATVFLPEGKANEEMARAIFADMSKATKDLGIALCGGHTEITAGLDRPIVVGQMLGEVEKDRLVLKTNARAGDDIILTKGIAIEGTAILAREQEKGLTDRYGKEFVKRAQAFLYDPGLSIVREASIASETGKVHAMHDLTEGGLSTGIIEMADIAGLGATVERSSVHCYPETEAVCSLYGLDPMGMISSGALLIALAHKDTESVLGALRQEGIRAGVIGTLTERDKGLNMIEDGEAKKFPTFEVDEIARLFEAEGKPATPLPR